MGVEELIQPAAMHVGGVRNRLLAAPSLERCQHHRPAPSKELINHPLRLRQLGSNLLELNQVVRTSRHTHLPSSARVRGRVCPCAVATIFCRC